jgi:carotenoid 1,2-hydratase
MPNGYRWWYFDATSDDGAHGFTIIGFVGSVFSPYYARARKSGDASPENHCAINVALYGQRRRWAMTERGAGSVVRTSEEFRVGPSSMKWENQQLTININERCMPIPYPLMGQVVFSPQTTYQTPVKLDQNGKHHWQAVAPHGRVTVRFENPNLTWSGNAYHDMNWGDEPLERGFKSWTWLRAKTDSGTHVLYDVERRDASCFAFGRIFAVGEVRERLLPDLHALPRGLWRMPRDVRSDTQPKLLAKLEDAPFYTRNHIAMSLDGKACEAFHESLSLDRFTHPVVQMMLPFRMPRLR